MRKPISPITFLSCSLSPSNGILPLVNPWNVVGGKGLGLDRSWGERPLWTCFQSFSAHGSKRKYPTFTQQIPKPFPPNQEQREKGKKISDASRRNTETSFIKLWLDSEKVRSKEQPSGHTKSLKRSTPWATKSRSIIAHRWARQGEAS